MMLSVMLALVQLISTTETLEFSGPPKYIAPFLTSAGYKLWPA